MLVTTSGARRRTPRAKGATAAITDLRRRGLDKRGIAVRAAATMTVSLVRKRKGEVLDTT